MDVTGFPRWSWLRSGILLCGLPLFSSVSGAADDCWIRKDGKIQAAIVPPSLPAPVDGLVPATLNGYFSGAFGWTLPEESGAAGSGVRIIVGNESTNPAIRDLVAGGLKLDLSGLGEEGFLLSTHASGDRRLVVVAANAPLGLKHGCQELAFFRTAATEGSARIDWPLAVRMRPRFAHRAVYMLPCWSAHDSLESWRRVLRFHSELTLNRNWFWLAGFPLLEAYGGEYAGTDLADAGKVRSLVDLCRSEGMKFYIGGGWFTWHHEKHAAGSIERGVRYYLDLVKLLPGAEGIYLEPPGEGYEVAEAERAQRTEALLGLLRAVWKERPDFEFAVAIGKFNAKSYREALHAIDDKRLFWWWCWGDPIRDGALSEHPLILRWHTVVRMSDYHGSTEAPRPEEAPLQGFATSYDPGQGFGNSWNGWGKLGVDRPRDFDPRTMPFFSHQYLFRERAWNPDLSREEFARRLARRLFDEDLPPEAIGNYLLLADLCKDPGSADEAVLERLGGFIGAWRGKGTPRNRDTLSRMDEALRGIRSARRRVQGK